MGVGGGEQGMCRRCVDLECVNERGGHARVG
jgi:hypothetical protein